MGSNPPGTAPVHLCPGPTSRPPRRGSSPSPSCPHWTHQAVGHTWLQEAARTNRETPNTHRLNPGSHLQPSPARRPPALRRVNTHSHPQPPAQGTRRQPLAPGAGVRALALGYLGLLVPLGFQSRLWEGEERQRGVRDGRAGRGGGRRKGGREGERREGSRGLGRRREARRRLWQRARGGRGGGGGSGGAESLDPEPRARLGGGRGGAAGAAALPAWAEPRDTGLASPHQPQVGRGWHAGKGVFWLKG